MNNRNHQERAMGQLAKRMAVNCVRNTQLELIHEGTSPVTRTGDHTDVRVIDGEGKEIAWAELQRITDAEMKDLMITVVNRLYTVLTKGEDPEFANLLSLYDFSISKWNAPQIDEKMIGHLRHVAEMVQTSDANKEKLSREAKDAT